MDIFSAGLLRFQKKMRRQRGFFVTIYRLEDSIDNRCVKIKKKLFSVGEISRFAERERERESI